jgi:hypothetical protein
MATTAHMVEEKKTLLLFLPQKKFYQQVDCIRRRIRRLIANHSLVTFFLTYYKQTPLGINIIRNCPF